MMMADESLTDEITCDLCHNSESYATGPTQVAQEMPDGTIQYHAPTCPKALPERDIAKALLNKRRIREKYEGK